MKTLFTILTLLLHLFCIGQNNVISLVSQLKDDLDSYKELTKNRADLTYINPFYFDTLIQNIDQTIGSSFNQLDSSGVLLSGLVYFQIDSTVAYFYECFQNGQNTHHFEGCNPQSDGSYSRFYTTQHVDTISNVIITIPSKTKYEVYHTSCPGGMSKTQAIDNFKSYIYGYYQIRLHIYNNKINAYFIAPPDPKNKIRLKHTAGHY